MGEKCYDRTERAIKQEESRLLKTRKCQHKMPDGSLCGKYGAWTLNGKRLCWDHVEEKMKRRAK